jgi:predicted DNA-binding transcriptional regulator AlpA
VSSPGTDTRHVSIIDRYSRRCRRRPPPNEIPHRLIHPPRKAEILLGLSHASVYRLIRDGRLVAVKIGGRTGITRASIEAVTAGDAP